MNKTRGFTLIELVIVILILGILAAFATPKFMGLDREARKSVIASLEATVKSLSDMGHAMAVLQGQNEDKGKIDNNGTMIEVIYGYLPATDKGIVALVELDKKHFLPATCVGNYCEWKAKVRNPDLCKVRYTWNADPEETRLPYVGINTKNCGNSNVEDKSGVDTITEQEQAQS